MTGREHSQGSPLINRSEDQGIGYLVLSNPPSNEMNLAFFHELQERLAEIRKSGSLRGLVITGIGRHFSSGAALEELLDRIVQTGCGDNESHFLLNNYRMLNFFEDAPFPVVAAVRGVCLGSAFELALLCHFRICTEDAVFGLPESTFNLMPGLGGIRKIASLSGKANALELALRGKTFRAAEALELGLVDAIVPKKELAARSVALIRSVSMNYHKENRLLYKTRYLGSHVPFENKTV